MTDGANEPWFPIEQRLRDDSDGRERDALLQRLDDAARAAKRRMDAGLPPAEFAGTEQVYVGMQAARAVVSETWRRYRPAPKTN